MEWTVRIISFPSCMDGLAPKIRTFLRIFQIFGSFTELLQYSVLLPNFQNIRLFYRTSEHCHPALLSYVCWPFSQNPAPLSAWRSPGKNRARPADQLVISPFSPTPRFPSWRPTRSSD